MTAPALLVAGLVLSVAAIPRVLTAQAGGAGLGTWLPGTLMAASALVASVTGLVVALRGDRRPRGRSRRER